MVDGDAVHPAAEQLIVVYGNCRGVVDKPDRGHTGIDYRVAADLVCRAVFLHAYTLFRGVGDVVVADIDARHLADA